jgi:hypothetical protein
VPGGYGLAGSLVSTALGLSLAYVIAYGMNRTIERPFISLGHRITRRRRRAFDEALTERPAPEALRTRSPTRGGRRLQGAEAPVVAYGLEKELAACRRFWEKAVMG